MGVTVSLCGEKKVNYLESNIAWTFLRFTACLKGITKISYGIQIPCSERCYQDLHLKQSFSFYPAIQDVPSTHSSNTFNHIPKVLNQTLAAIG